MPYVLLGEGIVEEANDFLLSWWKIYADVHNSNLVRF